VVFWAPESAVRGTRVAGAEPGTEERERNMAERFLAEARPNAKRLLSPAPRPSGRSLPMLFLGGDKLWD
jgi:hypothetical protein